MNDHAKLRLAVVFIIVGMMFSSEANACGLQSCLEFLDQPSMSEWSPCLITLASRTSLIALLWRARRCCPDPFVETFRSWDRAPPPFV